MIRSWLARNVFYPAQDALRGRDSLRYWRDLEDSQWRSADHLREIQEAKLRKLAAHAVARTPFYRARFAQAGLAAERIGVEALHKLPVLTKEDVRTWREQMIDESVRGGLTDSCTSGSTGSPLLFSVDQRRCRSDVAARIRAHRWFNVAPGDPVVYLWGARIEIEAQDRLKAVRDWLINEKLLNAFELDDESLYRYCDTILRTRPLAVYSYAGTLWRLAQFVHEHRPELKGVVRSVAFATGERMLPDWRDDIIRFLECSVAEEYGCREGGLIAHECPAEAYHIMAENVIVEILDEAGRPTRVGEEGEIVMTNLEAYGMPFIRYATGDRAALRPGICPCNRGLPMMWRPTGRSFEFLETNDGVRITGVSLSRDIKEVEGIAHYRVIQEARNRVRILVVPNHRFQVEKADAQIRRLVRARLGPGTEVFIEHVPVLPPHPSGKYRYIVNAIPARGC